MKTRLLIIVGIVVILVASSSFIALTLQQTSQQCELLGGKIAGLFSCSDKYPTPNNEPKTASDCRMIFGKGTTEMYDCLEEIAKIPCETIDGDNPRFICNTDEIYSDEPEPEPAFDSKEQYTIEITGLKDVYIVGEQYDFSYIIPGFLISTWPYVVPCSF